jgi:hypothetical protein
MSRKSRVVVVAVVTTALLLGASIVGAISTFEDVALWGADGGHHVSTPARPRVVDLQIAIGSEEDGLCGTYSDNATTPVIQATLEPPISSGRMVCLRNAGATRDKPINVKASFTKVSDVDTDCTGQEADFDTTCGNNGVGEAGPLLVPRYYEVDCDTGNALTPFTNFGPLSQPVNELTFITNQPLATRRCFFFVVWHDYGFDETLEQAGQSDTVSFTIAFTAQYTTGS